MGLVKNDRPVIFNDEVVIRGALTVEDMRVHDLWQTDHPDYGPVPELDTTKPVAIWPIRDQGGNVVGWLPLYGLKAYDPE